MCYSLWYKAPTMLPADGRSADKFCNKSCVLKARDYHTRFQYSCLVPFVLQKSGNRSQIWKPYSSLCQYLNDFEGIITDIYNYRQSFLRDNLTHRSNWVLQSCSAVSAKL